MGKLSNSSGEFLRKHPLDQSSIIRGFAALMLSAGTGLGVIYVNYHSYWKVTIYRTQTVDFNILANLLPAKVSTHLLKNDKKGLQEALDTNYGLFGIFVTDCKSVEVDCPGQKITYGSKFKIEQISNSKQRLIPEGNYADVWAKKFAETDTPSQLLKNSDYVLLHNLPSIKADWKFNSPRDSNIILSQQKNTGKIVGRIYFVRGNPPSFLSELEKWLKNPLGGNLVYNAIAGSALLTGLLAWLLSEIFHYRSRKVDRLKIEFERKIRQASEQVTQANIDKFKAKEDARLAQTRAEETARRLNATNQEKLQAEEDARLAQTRAEETARRLDATNQEKLQAEEDARLAQTRAEETARRLDATNQEKLQVEEDRQYLYESIRSEDVLYEELKRENENLRIIISEIEASRIDDNIIAENTTVECSTVSEALKVAGEKFTILNVWDNAYTTASDVNGSSPRRVYTVLEILAKVGDNHFQQTTNNGIIYLLNEEGIRCSRESMKTMNKYGFERDFPRRGKPVKRMEMHIKVGRQLRIYFDVDTENEKIIIGYCGKHLRTVSG
jgi:hypothetical protein